jgi:hypothetical protein
MAAPRWTHDAAEIVYVSICTFRPALRFAQRRSRSFASRPHVTGTLQTPTVRTTPAIKVNPRKDGAAAEAPLLGGATRPNGSAVRTGRPGMTNHSAP